MLAYLSIGFCIVSYCVCALASPEPQIVRYHNSGYSDKHNAFQFELIHRALDITRAEFGEYQVKPYSAAHTAKRQAILLAEGKLMNMHWASPGTPIAQGDVIQIPVNILQGLLGYRVCVVNRHKLAQFARINSLEALRHIRIGQGQDWTDTRVYRHNNIAIVEAPGLENLFPILASGRIDCLALGVNEVHFKYRMEQDRFPQFVIEPSLLLYYDFPTYLYVSKNDPQLARRMTRGLVQLQASGEFERLFNQYFAGDLAQLNLARRRVVCLKSPYIPQATQCTSPVTLPALAIPGRVQD